MGHDGCGDGDRGRGDRGRACGGSAGKQNCRVREGAERVQSEGGCFKNAGVREGEGEGVQGEGGGGSAG
eukprot:1161891-Pelagomonas_calceolata.AAC.4